ncbi:MAG: GGDEF domain-containing protein [Candidatus Thiodiazotropha sp. (ex Ctena orbiculata)]|uniref:diguanylate cyclase n=1 Tax=Candidatus Thiodiazotropha taylori TaxID=2792791 RepID=A0A944QV15_9GAMM|nr:GGDEF domain-containing protein [Candidatus Thiodiazotropha taylori]MBT2989026.1 GGDEF domain-containing protein [Candidatus Thiodiazotropha taylori]MBT2996328.1 GGDEF domain-containing protein [Candidatus Thiodiazotropha taylori]MBT3000238.1 GGDEF domain-containing protein [Candidatus Thiodiazotropha taylori]MBT3028164.1 GGDEF domain-containing protein [Candidatus Thiodiazotropha taylori]
MNYLIKMYISLIESLGIHTKDQLYELFSTKQHGVPISRHRAAVMQSRVFFFSVIFALLVPAWSIIDILYLPAELWSELLLIRLVAALCFAVIAWQSRAESGLLRARILLAAMLAITPLFYLLSDRFIEDHQLTGAALVLAEIYALLPFVMVAGLTLFPLAISEFLSYALPIFFLVVYSVYPQTSAEIPEAASTIWLLILLLGIALFASMTQLRYMLSQVSHASYDVLTGMLSRRAGIEILELQFRLASMSEKPMSILYFDLDNFKVINDTYGHDAGDTVLRVASQQIRDTVRKGDSVIRWGGEEFIVVLPTADHKEANDVITRIMLAGLGDRPDGAPVTASIGIAEIRQDRLKDWKSQVELADHRMYTAKSNGRARCVGAGGHAMEWVVALEETSGF